MDHYSNKNYLGIAGTVADQDALAEYIRMTIRRSYIEICGGPSEAIARSRKAQRFGPSASLSLADSPTAPALSPEDIRDGLTEAQKLGAKPPPFISVWLK